MNDKKPQTETAEKQPYTAPKLTWVQPELVQHGEVKTVAGIVGTFTV